MEYCVARGPGRRLAEFVGMASSAEPYWLFGFEEICAGCGMQHAHAVTVRCIECDGPQCPFCVVIIESGHRCGECAVAADEEPD